MQRMYYLVSVCTNVSRINHRFEEHGVGACFDIENQITLALNISRNQFSEAGSEVKNSYYDGVGWRYDMPTLQKIDVYEYDCLQRYLPNWSTTSFNLDTIRQSAAIIRAINRPLVIDRGVKQAFIMHDRNRLAQPISSFDALVGFTSIGSSLHILPDLSATWWKDGSSQSVQLWSEHEIMSAYEEAERLSALRPTAHA